MKVIRNAKAAKFVLTFLFPVVVLVATYLLLMPTFSMASELPTQTLALHKQMKTMRLPVDGYALSLAWSHDGRLLAAASENFAHVTIWDSTTGQIVKRFERGLAFGHSLAFMPGDKYLLTPAAYQKTQEDQRAAISLWDIATGKMVRNVPGPYPAGGVNESMADSFSLGGDGRILAVVFHGRVPVTAGTYETADWDLTQTFEPLSPLGGQPGVALAASIAVSPDGAYLGIGRTDGAIDIYEISTRRLLHRIAAYPERFSVVTSLTFSPDSKSLLSAPDSNGRPQANGSMGPIPDSLRIWNVSDGALALSFPLEVGGDFFGKVRGIAWSNDGRHVASASEDHVVRLWDIDNPRLPTEITRYSKEAWDVAFSPDGKLLAASGWGYVLVEEVPNSQ